MFTNPHKPFAIHYSRLANLLLALLVVIVFLVLSRAALPATKPQPKPITLAEAVALALRHNRTIESAYISRVLEKFDLEVVRDEFRPDLILSASTAWTRQQGNEALNTQVGAGLSLKVPTGGQLALDFTQTIIEPWEIPEEGFSSDVVLSFKQPLLRGGGVDVNMASQRLAERQEQANILNLKQTFINIITQVVHAYRRFLLVQRGVEINRLSLIRSKELLEVNKALIAAGRMAQVEIIQAEADLANQELSFHENENALDKARLSLLKLLDIDKHTVIAPVDKIVVKPVTLNLETLQQQALSNRPDYLQVLLARENAQTRLLLAENDQLWELDIVTRYNITGTSDAWMEAQERAGHLGEGDYSVGFALRIPIGDIQRQRGVVAARVKLRHAGIDVHELKENLEIEMLDAVRDISIKWEQVKLAQRARGLSKRQLDIELEKLKVNRSTNFRIVTFQNSLIRAKIDYLNALTDLDVLLGATLERWGVNIEYSFFPE
ncbi:MAG: TolC family protein [Candidatus Parabeggiatoa sp. nov. 1]|nr:MAG: TolC family protein [Gammaproteobacteria bacterium]